MSERVERYREQIENLTSALLRPYIERLSQPDQSPPGVKEINDAIWQTIVLPPAEVLILDSPILQRLRRVRQLGVVHWTYPCAVHSRLEHSIGCVLQVQRLLDSMNRNHPIVGGGGTIPTEWCNLMRLAALCHDVGHGLMSHVSENGLLDIPAVQKLRLDLQRFLGRKCSLSEGAAYFMLGSPIFLELIQVIDRRVNHKWPLPEQPAKALQDAVVGRVIHQEYPLLQELITGPYDADKLDYMPRDARTAGVPTVTDIPRLIQKVRLVAVPKEKLPERVARTVEPHPIYFITAVAQSGARTLDELMIGRTLLFDKVYRHQKVRAAEAMVGQIVSQIAHLLGDRAPLLPLLLDDEDLLSMHRGLISDKLGVEITDAIWTTLQPAVELAARLRDRRLFGRAYAFSPYMPRDPLRSDPDRRSRYERIVREMEQPEARSELRKSIVEHVKRARTLLPGRIAPSLSDAQIDALIALDPPSPVSETNQIARAFLVKTNGDLLPFRDDSPESSPWSNAYFLARDLGYIFAATEIADVVYLASELVFRKRYDVRTPASASDYAKVDMAKVNRLRLDLTRVNFYQGYPNDLRAEPERLRKADVLITISKIVEKLGQFAGLSAAENNRTVVVQVDMARVTAWLKQFSTDDEIDAALAMLKAMRVVDRADLQSAIEGFIGGHPEFKGAYVCPFGSPKDSSYILTYYAQDMALPFELQLVTLNDALTLPQKPILFVDDFIGSGGQSSTILADWYGRAEAAPLEEDHGGALNESAQEELRRRRVGFIFVAGDQRGVDKLTKTTQELKLNAVVHVHIPSSALPKAFEGDAVLYSDSAQRQKFKEVCESLGEQLLTTGSGKERAPTWIKERVLGYGNDGYLVVFPYNVPTQTLTALWHGGTVNGGSWLPLLPRRKKV